MRCSLFRETPTWQMKNMVSRALHFSCNEAMRLFVFDLNVDVEKKRRRA